jgi:hypothetical protein
MRKKKILLRSGRNPNIALLPEATLEYKTKFSENQKKNSTTFAGNIGNIVFADSSYRFLKTDITQVESDGFQMESYGNHKSYGKYINRKFDAVVLPLANAFRKTFLPRLNNLIETIKYVKKPVILAGVTVTENDFLESDEVRTKTREFLNLILDRSNCFGVRGYDSYNLIKTLGYSNKQMKVIGCPSLFLNGVPPMIKKTKFFNDMPISLSISPYLASVQNFVESVYKNYKNLIYVPQNSQDLKLLLYGIDDTRWKQNTKNPLTKKHPLYKQNKMRFSIDTLTWSNLLQTRNYSIGTRIHGTIMSLLSGTPATILWHDLRTKELAEYYNIPNFKLSDYKEKYTVKDFYKMSDWTKYNSSLNEKYEILNKFFNNNGLGTAKKRDDLSKNTYANPVEVREINKEMQPKNLISDHKPNVKLKAPPFNIKKFWIR